MKVVNGFFIDALMNEDIPTVASFLSSESERYGFKKDVSKLEGKLRNSLSTQEFPITFVARDKKNFSILGCVGIDYNEWPFLERILWVSNLFVLPRFRNRGVGSELLKKCIEQARKTEESTMRLLTLNSGDYFSNNGWEFIYTENILQNTYDVYHIELERVETRARA
ncbi:hypothetical protein CJF42_21045 [Pseudoalteromonas sp. NBT06-2]|uniref:GNAT family N-acetyltransferase n=1 Tax=Pseudoalteromonas sp. NBT06-2 TaxID=2025950 RepID=UPI000BA6CC6C|nr:GNAT family N-acetyltransferase [Pseudoalteromonas sp. NBT06-2]PAJ72483.1 hypothetical protein CJF42_21045 [Pseudoalteromonas sp. NBT06-2]